MNKEIKNKKKICQECEKKEATKEIYLSKDVDGQAIDCYLDVCSECYKSSK